MPSCARPVYFPPSLGGAAFGVGLRGGRRWRGSSPPLSFFWLRGGGVCGSRSCTGSVVFAAARSGLGPLGLRPPFPFCLGCVCFFFVGGGPPLLRWGVPRRVRIVLCSSPSAVVWSWLASAFGWVSPGLAGCFSGVLLGGPVGVAFGVAWLGGLPSACGMGVRLCGCVTVSRPPPFLFRWARVRGSAGVPPLPCFLVFFGGGVWLFLPLPSLDWCTPWSAFGVANRVAVGAAVGCRPCSGPMGWVGYVHAWPGGLSRRTRFWLCRLGGCASQSWEVLGQRGAGLSVSPRLCGAGGNFLVAVFAGRLPSLGGGVYSRASGGL